MAAIVQPMVSSRIGNLKPLGTWGRCQEWAEAGKHQVHRAYSHVRCVSCVRGKIGHQYVVKLFPPFGLIVRIWSPLVKPPKKFLVRPQHSPKAVFFFDEAQTLIPSRFKAKSAGSMNSLE